MTAPQPHNDTKGDTNGTTTATPPTPGSKIVLIGAGDVGIAYAYTLVNQGLTDHLAIIDLRRRSGGRPAWTSSPRTPQFSRRSSAM